VAGDDDVSVLTDDDLDVESVTPPNERDVELDAPPMQGVECIVLLKAQVLVMNFLELKIKSKLKHNSHCPNSLKVLITLCMMKITL
jgi:hypothetical protein